MSHPKDHTQPSCLYSQATNDDLILLSCIKLHERVDHTHHSVVLLTDDRNLRVKSHASHMPVRSIPSFIKLLSSVQ